MRERAKPKFSRDTIGSLDSDEWRCQSPYRRDEMESIRDPQLSFTLPDPPRQTYTHAEMRQRKKSVTPPISSFSVLNATRLVRRGDIGPETRQDKITGKSDPRRVLRSSKLERLLGDDRLRKAWCISRRLDSLASSRDAHNKDRKGG